MAGNEDGYRQRSGQKRPYGIFHKPSSPFRETPQNELETDIYHSRALDHGRSSISQDKNNQERQTASPKRAKNEESGYKTPSKDLEADLHHSKSPLSITSTEKSAISFAKNGEASDHSGSSNSQDKNNQERHIAASRSLSKWPSTSRILSDFKKNIEPSLRTLLRELSGKDLDMEHCFEIADSAYVLTLFSFSNPEFEDFVQKAGDGEKKLREGLMLVKQGHDLLISAVTGMLQSSNPLSDQF